MVRNRRPPLDGGRTPKTFGVLARPPCGCALRAGLTAPNCVWGFLPFLTMELVFSQRAESNRSRTSLYAGQLRQTTEFAAGLIQIFKPFRNIYRNQIPPLAWF